MRRWRDPGRRGERGAIAVVTALLLVVVISMAAMAVDLGMQRVVRSDMQALADMVALDTARLLDGRTAGRIRDPEVDDRRSLEEVAHATAERNGSTLSDDDRVEAVLVLVEEDEHGALVPVRLPNGELEPVPDDQVPEAVFVRADGAVDFAFAPGSGGARRTALAQAQAGACFSIGSYAARLDTGDSPLLGPLLGALGSNVTLDAVDYRGLADASVSLVDFLGVDVGAGTIREVLDAGELISLGDYYLAVAEALEKGSGRTVEVGLLEAVAPSVSNLEMSPADVLALGTGSGAAGFDAALNVFDLVTAGAVAANGSNGVAVPGLVVDLGPIADVSAAAHVTQRPQIACGREGEAVAHSAQVRVDLDATALDLAIPGVAETSVTLSGWVEAASATGTLTDVRCAPEGITVAVDDGLLTVDLTLDVTLEVGLGAGNVDLDPWDIIPDDWEGTSLVKVSGPLHLTGHTTSSGEAVITIEDPSDYDRPVRVSNDSSGLPTIDTTEELVVTLLGLDIPSDDVLDVVLAPLVDSLVNPVVAMLDDALQPLLTSLGLDLTGADVYAEPTPKCGLPVLRG